MADTFDKSTTLNIDGEVMNRSSFGLTEKDKLARRVINEDGTGIRGQSGTTAFVGVYGEILATDIKNDVLVQFQYNISDYDVVSTIANGGTIAQADNMAVLSTGTATNGSAEIESTGKLRYRPGHTALAQFSVIFSPPKAGSRQQIGPFNDTDGFNIGYIDTDMVITYIANGVTTVIPSAEFNGDDLSGIDFTKLNVFRINFGWLGSAPVIFEMFEPSTNSYITIHSLQLQGVADRPHIGNPAMPVHMHVENDGNDTDMVMKTGSWQSGVMGLCQTCGNRPFQLNLTAANIGAAETVVAVFENKTLFHGKNNKVRAKLVRYQFQVDPIAGGNNFGLIQFRLIADPVLTGTPSWVDIDTNNSVMRYDTAQAYTANSGIDGIVEWVGYTGGVGNIVPTTPINAEDFGLFLDPNRQYVLLAQRVGTASAGSPDIRVSINWAELF